MRAIHLHGRLAARFGAEPFQLDVASLAEAVRALCSIVPGFRAELRQGAYKVIAGRSAEPDRKGGLELDEGQLTLRLGCHRRLHIIPVLQGAGSSGHGKIILGVALIAGAVLLGPAGFGLVAAGSTFMGVGLGSVAMVGASLVLAGVSQMLAPSLKSPGVALRERQESFIFNGPTNATEQGHPVPVVLGRFRVGSIMVTAGIDTATIPVATAPGGGTLVLHRAVS